MSDKHEISAISYVSLTDLEKAIHHLLWVWLQYNSYGAASGRPEDKNVYLEHACMVAGENAAAFLEGLGCGHSVGRGFVPNEKGYLLMLAE
jgi:hypothetical protein